MRLPWMALKNFPSEVRMIIGICGEAGSGKDTAADFLVKHHGFVKVALADPMKRFCSEVFGWSKEQLWGPSEERNKPDPRNLYGTPLRDPLWFPMPLTPRHALQQLGTQWGRGCFEDVWVEYAVRVHERLQSGGYAYDQQRGLFSVSTTSDGICGMWPKINVVISDIRFKNEINCLKENGAKIIRIRRGAAGLEGAAGQHVSETEQKSLPDKLFDLVLDNNGTLEELYEKLRQFVAQVSQESTPAPVDRIRGVSAHRISVDDAMNFPLVDRPAHELALEVDPGQEVILKDRGGLSDLLRQRAEDIKKGRIVEYDPAQVDVPPFKRSKK